jgi:hypothetical protein
MQQQLVYNVRLISRVKTHLTQDKRNLGLVGSNSISKRNQLSGEGSNGSSN